MTVAEAAVFFGCSRAWVRRLIEAGKLRACKKGAAWDVDLDDATAYWVDVLADRGDQGRWAVIAPRRPRLRRLFDRSCDALLQALQWGAPGAPCKILDRKTGKYLTPPPQ
jgi:excisionase family DNA binding protein